MPSGALFVPRQGNELPDGAWVLEGSLFRKGQPFQATAIPYPSWSNRGPGEMVEWLDTTP